MSPIFGGDAEEADNTEAGVRYSKGTTNLEVMYFSSYYASLKGECKNSSGGDCDAGDIFDGGAVDVSGLEIAGSWMFEGEGVSYPVGLTYTSTDATFGTSFDNGDYWGTVAAGDDVPYIPSLSLIHISEPTRPY